ncbi:DUF4193 domain-containing protein [Nocardia asteroides]|uniref:DUF4193 domain-containing protein n=1 Tax=Nocardia asteroides TaxID=1824 RepID=UPI00344AAFC8
MAVDYDARRDPARDDSHEVVLPIAQPRRTTDAAIDIDEGELLDGLELPGADLSGEELTLYLLPRQADEFTCGSCFLVHHRSRLSVGDGHTRLCRDCA